MDEPKAENETSTEDRRGAPRNAANRPMSLTIDGAIMSGQSRDLSNSSVFFLSDDEMRMVVRFTDEQGDGRPRTGRLIRYQSMPDAGSGWAIEFDD